VIVRMIKVFFIVSFREAYNQLYLAARLE
jgi:hypothetical protein